MNNLKVKRHEIKYVMSYYDSIIIKNKLDHILSKDEHCKDGDYTITSLYYDDINNTALKQKIDGDAFRYKYRIRFYNNDRTVFKLERKEKIHQITSKHSLWLNRDEVDKILNRDVQFLLEKDSLVATHFANSIMGSVLKPKVIVEYKRAAYMHKVGNLRITFDTDLKASFNNHDIFDDSKILTSPLSHNEVIMEIKFNGNIPTFIQGILQSSNITAASMSKYVFSRKYNYNL